jgi:hypothetical protein
MEARQMVAESINARVSDNDVHSDVVLFAGSGTTGAVNKVRCVSMNHAIIALPRS